MTPRVSVLLPCRNEARHIAECLESILSQETPEGGFELLVIDGNSDDETLRILHDFAAKDARVRVLSNPQKFVSHALNLGIRAARGEIIVRMDAHSIYAPDYLRMCVDALERTNATNVGGPARTMAKTYIEGVIAAAYHSPFAVGGARFHDTSFEGYVDTVPYGCWRRAAFEKFGYFDVALVRNQDDEHNLRITRGGGAIWQTPSIMSWYRPRSSFPALFQQYRQYGYWKVRVIRKHKLPASIRHLVPGAFLLLLSALVVVAGVALLAGEILPSIDPYQSSKAAATFISRFSLMTLASIAGLYATLVAAASVITAASSRWRFLPALPFAFACYHFGYGLGFLEGLADFVLLKRSPRLTQVSITRSS